MLLFLQDRAFTFFILSYFVFSLSQDEYYEHRKRRRKKWWNYRPLISRALQSASLSHRNSRSITAHAFFQRNKLHRRQIDTINL